MTHCEKEKPQIVTGSRSPSSDTEVEEWNPFLPLTAAVTHTGEEKDPNTKIYPTTYAENETNSTHSHAVRVIKYKK